MWQISIDQRSPKGGHMRHPSTTHDGPIADAVEDAVRLAGLTDVEFGDYQIDVMHEAS